MLGFYPLGAEPLGSLGSGIAIPVSVEVALPGFSVSPPAVVVSSDNGVDAPLPSLTISAPGASVAASAVVSAAMPSVTMTPPTGSASASISLQIALPSLVMSSVLGKAGLVPVTPSGRTLNLPISRLAGRTLAL